MHPEVIFIMHYNVPLKEHPIKKILVALSYYVINNSLGNGDFGYWGISSDLNT